jgi:hypothetical protein
MRYDSTWLDASNADAQDISSRQELPQPIGWGVFLSPEIARIGRRTVGDPGQM